MNKRRRYLAKRRRARRRLLAILRSRVPRSLRGFIDDEVGIVDAWQWRYLEELVSRRRDGFELQLGVDWASGPDWTVEHSTFGQEPGYPVAREASDQEADQTDK